MATGTRTGGRCLQLNVLHLPKEPTKVKPTRFNQPPARRHSSVWLTTTKGVFRFGVTPELHLELKQDEGAKRWLPRPSLHLDVPEWRRPWLAAFQVLDPRVRIHAIPLEAAHSFSEKLIHIGDRLWVFSGLATRGVNLGIIEKIEILQDIVQLDDESHLRDDPGLLVCG